MENFTTLLDIVRRKALYDEHNPWYAGPESYLRGLKDELGDLLWNCLNSVYALEKTTGITLDAVLDRACRKFAARLAGLEAGRSWQDIKAEQKRTLADEQAARDGGKA